MRINNRLLNGIIGLVCFFITIGCNNEKMDDQKNILLQSCESNAIYVETFNDFYVSSEASALYSYTSFLLGICTTDIVDLNEYFNGRTYNKRDVVLNAMNTSKSVISGSKTEEVMNNQLLDFLLTTFEPSDAQPYICQYRTDELTNIEITADKQLFGCPPGEDVSNFFKIYRVVGNSDMRYPFFYTNNYRLVKKSIEGRRVGDLIGERPLVPAIMYLKLLTAPPEAPLDIQFNVTITLKGKAPMSDTTEIVRIIL